MTKKRGNKNHHTQEEATDPDRFVEVDSYMRRGQGRGNPHLSSQQRADTYGIRLGCGAEMLTFAQVDDGDTY